jgi:SAM-dependent methyltransferase/uncharacterized protein YbaR (Trm112 family)
VGRSSNLQRVHDHPIGIYRQAWRGRDGIKERLAEWLACPVCGSSFNVHVFSAEDEKDESGTAVDINAGILACTCGTAYPIVDGVPRVFEGALLAHTQFRLRWVRELESRKAVTGQSLSPASDAFRAAVAPTMERFSKEWLSHPLDDATWGLGQDERLDHALRYLGWTPERARGAVVLDAGCGTGKLTCGMAAWGGEVVGVDLGEGVLRGWQQRARWAGGRSTHVHLIQADLMNPPFRPGSFDGIHSAGVLHHTPDTAASFHRLAPLVRDGGTMCVWLYRSGREARLPWIPFVRARWGSVPARSLRALTTRLPASLLFATLKPYASVFHLFYVTSSWLGGTTHSQTIAERTTSLFDTFAPPFVWHHTSDEVRRWFETAGFAEIRETTVPGDPYGFSVTATRRPTPS